jgi:hypothetical protein
MPNGCLPSATVRWNVQASIPVERVPDSAEGSGEYVLSGADPEEGCAACAGLTAGGVLYHSLEGGIEAVAVVGAAGCASPDPLIGALAGERRLASGAESAGCLQDQVPVRGVAVHARSWAGSRGCRCGRVSRSRGAEGGFAADVSACPFFEGGAVVGADLDVVLGQVKASRAVDVRTAWAVEDEVLRLGVPVGVDEVADGMGVQPGEESLVIVREWSHVGRIVGVHRGFSFKEDLRPCFLEQVGVVGGPSVDLVDLDRAAVPLAVQTAAWPAAIVSVAHRNRTGRSDDWSRPILPLLTNNRRPTIRPPSKRGASTGTKYGQTGHKKKT